MSVNIFLVFQLSDSDDKHYQSRRTFPCLYFRNKSFGVELVIWDLRSQDETFPLSAPFKALRLLHFFPLTEVGLMKCFCTTVHCSSIYIRYLCDNMLNTTDNPIIVSKESYIIRCAANSKKSHIGHLIWRSY